MGDDRFAYKTMASIVQRQDRRDVAKNEPTGESDRVTTQNLKSLMGSAVVSEKPKVESIKKKRKQESTAISEAVKSAIQKNTYEDFLASGGGYEPSTKLTEKVWETILSLLVSLLPDVPRDVLRSAAEEVLNLLKDPERTAKDKRKDIENLVSEMTDEVYRSLVELADQLTDFVVQSSTNEQKKQRKRDTEIVIAFEGDEEEEEEEEEEEKLVQDEVVSSESEDENAELEHEKLRRAKSTESEEEELNVLDPKTIDAFWLQREISASSEEDDSQQLAEKVLTILAEKEESARENLLISLLGFERLELVKQILKNRSVIFYCTRLSRARNEEEREAIRSEMIEDSEGALILDKLNDRDILHSQKRSIITSTQKETKLESTSSMEKKKKIHLPSSRVIDINTFSRVQTFQKRVPVMLPKGSWSKSTKSWEEVHVRPVKTPPIGTNEKIMQISELPKWMQPAFSKMGELNRVQSKVYPAIMNTERFNMLVSAPTGSGKTNIAMLAVMQEISQFISPTSGQLNIHELRDRLKVVYIAPMKALVQEVVANFSSRLTEAYGIVVKELSGDEQLSRTEIASTQIIVSTPEKWDVITRKAGERSYASLVKLVIIDEIHLLHDSRGAVLEALIARILRNNEETKSPCRILGISATLPNFKEVAVFLRVPLDRGLFFFDNSFRPVPLQQVFIGVTEQKPITKMKTMDKICFDRVSESIKNNQVLVFVHSRKDTVKTAKFLRDQAEDGNLLQDFIPGGIASREILIRAGSEPGETDDPTRHAKNPDLRYLLPYGIAVHHAGLHKSDRQLVEALFEGGHIRVLISTATLAWGVNLPAHTVIIKGTQIYNPELGQWTELSQMDILQMLGRAGRPQFDEEGEGIVITSHAEMQYYLSLLNDQLQIESNLMKKLPDHLNAEVVCGNISSLYDAAKWLGYTFLYVRALAHPERYGLDRENEDPDFFQWRVDLAHSTFQILEKNQLIRYDRKNGIIQGTQLGRIASHYYLTSETLAGFVRLLEPLESVVSEIDLIRVLTSADEFKQVQVRHEEKIEVAKLLDRVPIPIKEPLEDPSSKINVLFQAYISRSPLEGYCLACDLVYVHQSAARLIRALFEICLYKEWANASRKALQLSLSTDHRLWKSQTPLRQLKLPGVTQEVLRDLEKKSLPFARLLEFSAIELGSLIRQPRLGAPLHQALHRIPKLELNARIQTLTHTVLSVELSLTADFEFEENIHGPSLLFWVLVEDVDSSRILHHEPFILKSRFAMEEHIVTFNIKVSEPLPPFFFIRVESDSYLHSESLLAVPLNNLLFPNKSSPYNELLDLPPIVIKDLSSESHREFFSEKGIEELSLAQTQAFPLLESGDGNVLICCPVGRTVLAELAILKCFEKDPESRVVYLHNQEDTCSIRFKTWSNLFKNKTVVHLTGMDLDQDLQQLQDCNIAICSTKVWEVTSRRWRQKSKQVLTELSLIVADDLHFLDSDLELILSRYRYLSTQLSRHIRIVALSSPITNAEDVSSWLDAKYLNLSPSTRPVPTEIIIKGFPEYHFETRMGMMVRPCLRLLKDNEQTVVFLPSKRHLKLCLIDFVNFLDADSEDEDRQLNYPKIFEPSCQDSLLKSSLSKGVGICHENLSETDLDYCLTFYRERKIRLCLITFRMLWKLENLRCHHSIILGTSWFFNKRYQEYNFPSLLKMMNCANLPSKCTQTIFCYEPRKNFLKSILFSSVNLESSFRETSADVLLSEIVSKTIESKQDYMQFFTWTLFYRRLVHNPSYYGMLSKTDLSLFLSDFVENVVADLKESHCLVESEEDETIIQPTSLGIISSYHDVRYTTIDFFQQSITNKTKFGELIEIVSSATEFIELASVRSKEEFILEKLARAGDCLSYKLRNDAKYFEADVKCNILIQAWCNRFSHLQPDQWEDLTKILKLIPKLIHALVDVCSSKGFLRVCLLSMEFCQTMIQQVWQKDSPLRQIPFFDSHLKQNPLSSTLKNVYDLIEMSDAKRDEYLSVLNEYQVGKVAEFCNAYPSLQVSFTCFVNGNQVDHTTKVHLKAKEDELLVFCSFEKDFDDSVIISTGFPHKKANNWWAVLGDEKDDVLYAMKSIQKDKVKLSCTFMNSGSKFVNLFITCDSYLGCDQKFELQIEVI